MDEKQFLDLYFKYTDRSIAPPRGTLSDEMQKFKKLTELIDYGCKFDNNGVCKHSKKGHDNPQMCCCSGCASSIGYIFEMRYSDLPTYAFLYDKKLGFWTPDGCSLPRELRSKTCLNHHCENVSVSARNLMSIIGGWGPMLEAYTTMHYTDYGKDSVYDHLRKRLLKENSKKVKTDVT